MNSMKKAESIISEMLKLAEVEINGSMPWDIHVHNERFFQRILSDGVLGLGESYMDGWWDCDDLEEFIYRVLKADLEDKISPVKFLIPIIKSKIMNIQSKIGAAKDVGHHYNLGNILFQNMLDKRMTYSCGYWKDSDNLDAAQEAKLDLVCKKIDLKSGMTLLDIGCGWGSLIKFAAERYGARSVGITLSEEQVKLGKELCTGLPVEIRLQDYRDLKEKYDRIVSIGMFEHVGVKNYRTFMKIVKRCLHDHGLFLLHTIGSNIPETMTNPWTDKYIFPGGMLPTIKQIANAADGLLVMEDWHNLGLDYSRTLRAWYHNFNSNWEKIKSNRYDERFYRMWKYFLLSCSGSFRARRNQLWQFVFSKQGIPGGYQSVR
jgi:cyclopropane-fatty-acyl-phospholipid synthase